MPKSSSPKVPGPPPVIISGYSGEEFSVDGCRSFVILPPAARRGGKQPWVWYAPTLPGLPAKEENWMFEKFLAAGLAIAGMDVGESFGSTRGRAHYTAFHRHLVEGRGFSRRPCLLARSRGGLMLYNWAAEHPESVAAIAGIYPVCNLASYPGLAKACGAYDLTEDELAATLAEHNPIERLAPLAKARVPILHLHGDKDAIVPLDQNSSLLAERYRQHGGEVQLIIFPGAGHDYSTAWFQSPELVAFVITHARQ